MRHYSSLLLCVQLCRYFRDHTVTVKSAIVAPASLVKSFVAPLTVFLNGNGGIEHIVNQEGASAVCKTSCVQYLC